LNQAREANGKKIGSGAVALIALI
jgi:hypothetical protein